MTNWAALLISAIVGAIVSVVAAFIGRVVIDLAHYDIKKICDPAWHSTWQISPDVNQSWASERVKITYNWREGGVYPGRFVLKNFDNNCDCQWVVMRTSSENGM